MSSFKKDKGALCLSFSQKHRMWRKLFWKEGNQMSYFLKLTLNNNLDITEHCLLKRGKLPGEKRHIITTPLYVLI